MTPNGIEYNLKKSPYIFTNDFGHSFHFSSEFYKNKFIKIYKENRKLLDQKMVAKYGIHFEIGGLADLDTYSSIETRGFYMVLRNKGVVTSKNNLKYVGGIKIL